MGAATARAASSARACAHAPGQRPSKSSPNSSSPCGDAAGQPRRSSDVAALLGATSLLAAVAGWWRMASPHGLRFALNSPSPWSPCWRSASAHLEPGAAPVRGEHAAPRRHFPMAAQPAAVACARRRIVGKPRPTDRQQRGQAKPNQATLRWPNGTSTVPALVALPASDRCRQQGPQRCACISPTWNTDWAKPWRPLKAKRAMRDDSGTCATSCKP